MIERSKSDDIRESKIAKGLTPFGYEKVNLGQCEPGDNLTFIYEAKESGFPKGSRRYGVFDMNPNIVIISAKRDNKKGIILLTGLNANYTDRKLERGKTILYAGALQISLLT